MYGVGFGHDLPLAAESPLFGILERRLTEVEGRLTERMRLDRNWAEVSIADLRRNIGGTQAHNADADRHIVVLGRLAELERRLEDIEVGGGRSKGTRGKGKGRRLPPEVTTRYDPPYTLVANSAEFEGFQPKSPGSGDLETSRRDRRDPDDGEMLLGRRVPFHASTWDLALFIGISQLGLGDAILAAVHLVANVLIQAIFCLLCILHLTADEFDSDVMNGLTTWRRHIAHDVKFMDTFSLATLADRVCSGDASLMMSSSQADMKSRIDQYIPEEGLAAGPWMCILAIACHCLSVVAELRGCLRLMEAVLELPREGGTVLRGDGEFSSISLFRVLWMESILLMRCVIAVVILLCGIVWLSNTTSISDLLLNAVALAFVVNIDELMFSALAPDHARSFLESMAPLTVYVKRSYATWQGFDRRALAWTVGMGVGMWFVYVVCVLDTVEKLSHARNIMCSGSLDFIFTTNKFGLVVVAPVERFSNNTRLRPYQEASVEDALLHVTADGDHAIDAVSVASTSKVFMGLGSLRSAHDVLNFEHLEEQGEADIVNLMNPFCKDFPETVHREGILEYLHATTQDYGIQTCKDAARYCGRLRAGIAVRMYCPETCACFMPNSTVGLFDPAWGCSVGCFSHPTRSAFLAEAPCPLQDPTVDELVNTTNFRTWLEQGLRSGGFGLQRSDKQRVWLRALWNNGCAGIATVQLDFPNPDPCMDDASKGWPLKSMRFYCPNACECRSKWMWGCPDSCRPAPVEDTATTTLAFVPGE